MAENNFVKKLIPTYFPFIGVRDIEKLLSVQSILAAYITISFNTSYCRRIQGMVIGDVEDSCAAFSNPTTTSQSRIFWVDVVVVTLILEDKQQPRIMKVRTNSVIAENYLIMITLTQKWFMRMSHSNLVYGHPNMRTLDRPE